MKTLNKIVITAAGYRRLVLALAVLLLMACGGSNISMPITDDGDEVDRNGEMVWVDLVTSDASLSKSFFSDLFGWSYNSYGAYNRAVSGPKPVSGIIEDSELEKGKKNSYWIISAAVEDIDAAVATATANGGKVLAPVEKIPGRGKVAVLQDPQGAVSAVMSDRGGYLRASKPEDGEWMWAELWAKDAKAAAEYYAAVLGCMTDKLSDEGQEYIVLKSAKNSFAGVVKSPAEEEEPIWLPVMRVDDIEASTNKAGELGATIFQKPIAVSSYKLALITTPNGAPFILQEANNK